jgi:hypothetical protein
MVEFGCADFLIGNEGSVTVPVDRPNHFYRVVETQ